MNDRFSSQLRQHLVETANERPAEGQLAAVVDAVATTRQRLPLVARLTWNPGRIGLLPSAAVRFGLVAAALAIAMAAGASLAGGAKPTTVFEGAWTSTDPGDTSAQILVVGPGNTPAVYFEDGYATGAACVNDPVKRFVARGLGEISGSHLDVAFPDGGGCGLVTVEVAGSYAYIEASDTLIDQDQLVWARAISDDRSTTKSPASQAPAPPAPSTPAPSIPMDAATFTSTVHGVSIDYPAGWQVRPATEPWTGGELSFDSPAADVLFDPALGVELYLVVASQPYNGLHPQQWLRKQSEWLCPGERLGAGTAEVDGTNAYALRCSTSQSAVLVFAETRGYVIRLIASAAEPELTETYSSSWLRELLETVDLRPEDAIDAVSESASVSPS